MSLKRIQIVNWVVDQKKWALAIQEAREVWGDLLPELLGVTSSTINGWAKGRNHPSFPHPSMGCFLTAVNALHLDPRDFFMLEDK